MNKVLVAGLPRSGTTWISKVLSCDDKTKYIHEPDNERQSLLSLVYKDSLRRFPVLGENDECEKYKTLFEKAYSGFFLEPYGKPSNVIRDLFALDLEELEKRIGISPFTSELTADTRSYIRECLLRGTIMTASYLSKLQSMAFSDYDVVLIKSVHSLIAGEFLNNELNISKTLLIFRHPASIVASHLRMDNKDIWRPILQNEPLLEGPLQPFRPNLLQLEDPLAKAGARIGAIYYLFENYLEMDSIHSVKYEDVCRNKIREFKKLYNELGLNWSRKVEEYIQRLNREGEGYEVKRVADKQIKKWKRELASSQISSIERGYRIFPPGLQYSIT